MSEVLPTQDPLLGHSFQDYEFVELLGRGAFGAVYRAKHPRLPTDVAVKYVYLHEPDQSSAAKNEINILAQLQHPNVVRIYDAFTFETHQLIMIEFVRGGSLRDALKKLQPGNLLDKRTILEGIKQVASALEYIHERGVLHLDLKPENILLDQLSDSAPTRFILTDFGIARFTHTLGGHVTAWGGTPLYMSPEHFGFGEGKSDWRSDIYSLGIILYELLIGKPPFHATELGLLANMHANDKPPPFPPQLGLPPALESLVMKTLEKMPENRFQSAGELYKALETIQYTFLHGGGTMTPVSAGLAQLVQQNIKEFEVRKAKQVQHVVEDGATAPGVNILIMHPDGHEENYTVASPSVVVGRSSKVDLILGYPQISRRHARIEINAQGQIFITDLGSINHTYLNGMAINPNERVRWNEGDFITIQGVTMLWQSLGAEIQAVKSATYTIGSADMARLLDAAHEQQPIPFIRLNLTPEIIHVETDKPVRVHVHVSAENTPSAYYDLRISGQDIDSRWYTLPAGRVLESGEQASFDLTIHAPTSGAVGGRTFEAVVEVLADNPDIPSAFRVMKIVVAPRMRFGVTLEPKEITHGMFGKSSRLLITNNGNYREQFDIFVESSDQLEVRPAVPNLEVEAGQLNELRLSFHPRRGASRMGRLLYTINVVSANTGITERINGSYVFHRRVPRFSVASFIFLLLLLAVLGIGGYGLITGQDVRTTLQQLLDYGRSLLESIFAR